MTQQNPLQDALRSRADQLGDARPLSLDDVKARARGIRRRRTAMTGLAAAAVLAVAVPIGVAATDRTGTGREDPPVAGPTTATPSETNGTTPDASPPARGVKIALTTEIDKASYAASIPLLNDRAIVMPDGSEVPVDADYSTFAPLGDGWVAVRRDDEGHAFADVLGADGTVMASEPSTGSLAVSADGTVVAYATPDGQLMTVVEGADPMPLVDARALPQGNLEPVAVLGSDSCVENAGDGGCTVLLNSEDAMDRSAWSVTAAGASEITGLLTVEGLSPDGSRTGITSVTDEGACSALLAPDGSTRWETCDYTLGRFSPDGRHVIGHPSYRSGIGDSSVAILDATSGDLVVEATNSAEHQSFLNRAVWDTDGTLLVTVFEQGSWSLMRLTPAGTLSTVAFGLGEDMDEVPLHLVSRP